MLGAWAAQLKTALQAHLKAPQGCREAAGTMTWAMQSGGDKQILRDQSGLKDGVSYFGLQIRVEVEIGQFLAGKQ